MTAVSHALVGGALAASVTNPVLGITLAAASHPFLDLVPHWDFGISWKKKSKTKFFLECILDLGLGVGLAYLLFLPQVNFWYLSLAILAAESWDLAEAPYWFFKWKFAPFAFIYKVQSRMQNRWDFPWGVISQIVVVGAIIILLSRYTLPF